MTLTGIEAPAILALRRDPRLLQIPSYLSAICVLVGIVWLLLLPLNEYSRQTYISENALLPGQVHTYFGGSEQRIFNAYVEEVKAMAGEEQQVYVGGQSISLRRTWLTLSGRVTSKLSAILKSSGLKVASQKYEYEAAGNTYGGENVYAILHAPRGDATEAIVLVAAWKNMDGKLNQSGVALALALARYFKCRFFRAFRMLRNVSQLAQCGHCGPKTSSC